MSVNIHEAKTHLSRLIERVLAGEEIVIAKGGRPVAKLVPIDKRSGGRTPGSGRGAIEIGDEFGTPLPDLEEFFG